MGDDLLHKIKFVQTFRQKLTLFFIAFVIYPAVIVAAFGYFKFANDIKTELLKSLNQRIENVGAWTIERFDQTKRFAMMLPYDGVLNDIFIKRKNGTLSNQSIYNSITSYLYSKFYSKQEIQAVSFCFTDNTEVVYIVNSDNSYNQYIQEIHPRIIEESAKLTGQYGYYVSDNGDIYVIRDMYDRFSFKQYGVIAIKIDRNYMLDYFSKEFMKDSAFMMLYNGQEIFEGGNFQDKNSVLSIMQGYDAATDTGVPDSRYKSNEVVNGELNLDNIMLQYGIAIPSDEFMGKYYDALKFLVILTFVVAIALLLAAIPLKNAIWSPIKELVGLMKHLGEGNLGVQAKRNSKDEFEFIFDYFNDMSSEIKYLFDVVYKEELARKEAQLTALQARINPHFLYNTLEIMNWKARISGNSELSEMIEALGTLMDASMDKGGAGTCKLSDEIKLIDSYIYIMKKRFGKRIEFDAKIDNTLMDATIPKLIIQPLLENAVVHGLEPLGGGMISISVQRISDVMVIEVSDNGTGMDDNDVEEYNKLFIGQESKFSGSTGIGIRNVHERIRLLYGEAYGLMLKKGESKGTVAKIHIPLIPPEQKKHPSILSIHDIPENIDKAK